MATTASDLSATIYPPFDLAITATRAASSSIDLCMAAHIAGEANAIDGYNQEPEKLLDLILKWAVTGAQ